MADVKISQLLNIQRRFLRSAQLERDFHDPAALQGVENPGRRGEDPRDDAEHGEEHESKEERHRGDAPLDHVQNASL